MNCQSCLKIMKEDRTFCNRCRKRLFDKEKCSMSLAFNRSEFIQARTAYSNHFSISGYQDKILLKTVGKKLVPTLSQGRYILKPVPSPENIHLELLSDLPANEHLSMQLASKFFNIQTAVNAMIYFSDHEPAYITRRFDFDKAGRKLQQEDFCQLLNRSEENRGKNYKYDCSYEEASEVIRRHCRSQINLEAYFKTIIFSYIIGNGDLHLKNFSLLEATERDFILTPAYDLVSTSIHLPNESRTALDFFIDYESSYVQNNGYYGFPDFLELAKRFGLPELRTVRFLNSFIEQKDAILEMIQKSFLSQEGMGRYTSIFLDRIQTLSH